MEEKEKVTAEETTEETVEEVSEAVDTPGEEAPEKSEAEIFEEKIKEANDKYLRLAAEYDNFRKRTAKEKEQLFGNGTAAAVEPFLAVYDNLERAMATACTDENYKKGVELIFAEFKSTLDKLKVEILDPKGEAFDPNFHNAVMQVASEELESGMIAQELQKGYLYRETVVRYSMVAVVE